MFFVIAPSTWRLKKTEAGQRYEALYVDPVHVCLDVYDGERAVAYPILHVASDKIWITLFLGGAE